MEVLCGESHSEQINISVTSVRFSGGTDAMIFNYKTVICSISFLCLTKHLVLRDAIKQTRAFFIRTVFFLFARPINASLAEQKSTKFCF